jgi:hypothetical protein
VAPISSTASTSAGMPSAASSNDSGRSPTTCVAASPPRVEASSLGDAAVLTGGLAVGLRAARENVFVNRVR